MSAVVIPFPTRSRAADRLPLGLASCPVCGGMSSYLNIHAVHIGLCDAHRLYWALGIDLFPTWQDEDRLTWDRNAAALGRGGWRPANAGGFVPF